MYGPILIGFLVGASAWPSPVDCPGHDAIFGELQRLGTAGAVAAFGSPVVTVQGTRMHVALRGSDGTISGVREVSAPASCTERAQVAAVLISAWVGAWSAGSFPDAARSPSRSRGADLDAFPSRANPPLETPAPNAPATAADAPSRPPLSQITPTLEATATARTEPAVRGPATALVPAPAAKAVAAAPPVVLPAKRDEAGAAAPARSTSATSVEVSAFGYGAHDGDAAALCGGMQAGYRFPAWLGVEAAFTANGERERSMAPGLPWTAAYRSYSLGIGLDLRRQLGPLLADLALLPELTSLSVEGRNLNPGRSFTRWGAATSARLRLGIPLGSWRPFVFATGSYALRGERLTVDGISGQSITLSRWSFGLGLGLAYRFGHAR